MNTVLLKFRILHWNRKSAKWVEIPGCKMDLTYSAGYTLVVHVQKRILWSHLDASYDFQTVASFRKIDF